MKKILSLLLAICTLFVLVACQNDTPEVTVTTDGEEVTKAPVVEDEGLFKTIKDDLPEKMDFGGEVINIAMRDNERYYSEMYITEETATLNVLNQAIYTRNLAVEERLNVSLNIILEDNVGASLSGQGVAHGAWYKVSVAVESGLAAYDIATGGYMPAVLYAMRGNYRNLQNIENLDLAKEYWSQQITEQLTIAGASFFTTGAISTNTYDSAFVVYFNKNLCGSWGIEADSVYQTVLNGDWTLDEMMALTKDIYRDKNGNNIVDNGDVYGFGLQVSSSTDGFYSACDITCTDIDQDQVVFAMNTMKLSDVVDKLNDFVWNSEGVVALSESEGSATNDIYYFQNQFANDELLFVTDWLYTSSLGIMRDMESDYGVLPYPKYDTDQKNYATHLWGGATLFAVTATVTNERAPMIGAVLEAMASGGQNTVMPAYYEKVLTARNIRDPESVKTMALIIGGINMDRLWFLYRQTSEVLMRNQIKSNSGTLMSDYRTQYTLANQQLESIYENFAKYKDQ